MALNLLSGIVVRRKHIRRKPDTAGLLLTPAQRQEVKFFLAGISFKSFMTLATYNFTKRGDRGTDRQ